MTVLFDGNLLIALTVNDHTHHKIATDWFGNLQEKFATCPITQGTLIRFLIREGFDSDNAVDVLKLIIKNDKHVFWEDSINYNQSMLKHVIGHRQVTDAYLLGLAINNRAKVATLDKGFFQVDTENVLLIN